MIYCNEIDPFCCEWLSRLMKAGELPEGHVDERSIAEVRPEEVEGYHEQHYFAGIGGWPLALSLVEVRGRKGRTIWTASCPCQPFSTAGKGKGENDSRHLWPVFFALARECQPDLIFGEQVASAAGYGWLDGVRADLESEGYAFGAADIPAAGVGAPHVRQRLYWGAVRLSNAAVGGRGEGQRARDPGREQFDPARRRTADGLADADVRGRTWEGLPILERRPRQAVSGPAGASAIGPWTGHRVVYCTDENHRRVPTEPGLQPLVNGIPRSMEPLIARLERLGHDRASAKRLLKEASTNRKGRLKGAGNAIVPILAATFVQAFMESVGELR